MRVGSLNLTVAILAAALSCAAQSDPPNVVSPDRLPQLTLTKTVEIPSELADSFLDSMQCDSDGNIYLDTDVDPTVGISEVSPAGDRVAVFRVSGASDLKVMVASRFALTPNGDLYQLVFPSDHVARYVMVFDKSGGYKSYFKLQTSFPWEPDRIVAFSSGDLLVTGLEEGRDRTTWPFTGIFAPDGKLRKEVILEDDGKLHDMAAEGNPKVTSPERPGTNAAVSRGALVGAQDGYVYLMRWLSPAEVYAISSGGQVVRSFKIDPGDAGYMPLAMRIAGSRIAVQFFDDHAHRAIVKITDLEGHDVAAYEDPLSSSKGPALGLAFACYAQNPERFIFLTTMQDGHVGLLTAEPR